MYISTYIYVFDIHIHNIYLFVHLLYEIVIQERSIYVYIEILNDLRKSSFANESLNYQGSASKPIGASKSI